MANTWTISDDNNHSVCSVTIIDFNPYNPMRPASVNPTWTALVIINGLTALPTAGVNALIVWTVFSDENLRLSPFNILLGELAVTDMFVGLVVQPAYCLVLGCLVKYCYSQCQFTAYVLTALVCNCITLVTLALACAERYLSIEHPNLYNRMVTGERVQKVAVISWILTILYLVTLTILLNNTNPILDKVPVMLLIFICSVVILYCSSRVQLTAYRQQKNIDIQHQPNALQPDESEQQERRRRELKQVFTMTALVIMSVIFITPVIIATAIQFAKDKDTEFNFLVGPICSTLVNFQSLANPAILALRLSYIRNGIKHKLILLISLFGFCSY